MVSSDTVTKLLTALGKAQLDIPSIPRTARNPHFKSKYATLDSVMDTVRPILLNNGLILTGGFHTVEGNAIGVTTRLWHVSGEWIEATAYVPLDKTTAQGAGSAITYGRRYSLCTLLGISTEDDEDGNAATASAPKGKGNGATKPKVSVHDVCDTIAACPTFEELEAKCSTPQFRAWATKLSRDDAARVRTAYAARKESLANSFDYGPPPMDQLPEGF